MSEEIIQQLKELGVQINDVNTEEITVISIVTLRDRQDVGH